MSAPPSICQASGLDKIEETAEGFSISGHGAPAADRAPRGAQCLHGRRCAGPSATLWGVQLRNLATVGGSIYSRFGFSDVLTMFLAPVELYKGGIVPLSEYAQRPYDRDILVRVIVPKEQAAFCYQSVRNSQTDFPVLTCAAAKTAGGFRVAIGARPGYAVLYTLQPNAAETPEPPALPARCGQTSGRSNMRGSGIPQSSGRGAGQARCAEIEGNR